MVTCGCGSEEINELYLTQHQVACFWHIRQERDALTLKWNDLKATAQRVYDKFGKGSDWTEWTDLRDALGGCAEKQVEGPQNSYVPREWGNFAGKHDMWTGPCSCGAYHKEGR